MPTRRSTASQLTELRQELEFVRTFDTKWRDLTEFTLESFPKQEITVEEIARFDELRSALNRLYPRIADRLGDPIAVREQFGRSEPLLVYGFLLQSVPHLGSFFHNGIGGLGPQYRQRFFETRALSAASLQRAMGEIEQEISALEAGPLVIDSLADQANEAGLEGFLSHLEEAESYLAGGAYDDAIHCCRRAIERLATEIANVIGKAPRKRRFGDAMSTLRDAGLVDDATHRSITTPNVGFWGWTSAIGTHDEADPDGSFEAGATEAQLAIGQARAIAEYLLSRLWLHLAAEEITQ